MRHVRMLGLCLVAALALGAYAVSSASALEWGQCEYVESGGNYTGPNCNKAAGEKAKPKGSGSYEWRKASEVAEKRVAEGKPANVPFTGESVGGGGVLSTALSACGEGEYEGLRVPRSQCENGEYYVAAVTVKVECESETNSGETEGKNKVANIAVAFHGCKIFGASPCSNTEVSGEIQTGALKGKLGWINKSTKEVGVVLEPAAHHGTFATFTCLGYLVTTVGVGNKKEGAFHTSSGCDGPCPGATPEEEKHGGYDQIISPITPVNTTTTEFTQVFTENKVEADPRNVPDHFEGKHISLLEDYQVNSNLTEHNSTTWSAAAEEITNTNTSEEAGEIKA